MQVHLNTVLTSNAMVLCALNRKSQEEFTDVNKAVIAMVLCICQLNSRYLVTLYN